MIRWASLGLGLLFVLRFSFGLYRGIRYKKIRLTFGKELTGRNLWFGVLLYLIFIGLGVYLILRGLFGL